MLLSERIGIDLGAVGVSGSGQALVRNIQTTSNDDRTNPTVLKFHWFTKYRKVLALDCEMVTVWGIEDSKRKFVKIYVIYL